MSAELNPWALILGNDWATIERLGSYALSYYVPEQNTEPLWEALRDGTIDLISTDHAPHTREEKEPGWTDGWKAHTGTPSAQFYVPLFLDAARSGRLSLERVVELIAAAPARVFGLADKGRLEVGADADMAIVDLERQPGDPRRDRAQQDRLDPVRRPDGPRYGRDDHRAWRGRVQGRSGRRPAWLRQAGATRGANCA